MPRWLHIIVQIGSAAAGILGAVQGVSWAPIASLGINSTLGIIQQSYNTDGTPQTVAFESKNK